ncbi:MAG TPA: 2-amino-4-hydroxy-6-hydroxymethyldihydropteridine diphosphokinase [Ktedonobacteraceae bacterium]|nr:2-amino-4-hydroxy-6-hydroxymethyldihydropteridine diphosphokinase [Ktedonobacteraceae bacterium]
MRNNMEIIFLALGSNVENRKQYIETAINLLREKVHDIVVAPLYETKPRYFEDQQNFLNTVLRGYTELEPWELLQFTQTVQQEVGRVERFRYGPREIDIDILMYDQIVYKDEGLEIPHSRLQERDFVLQPFADINPDFLHPVLKKTIKELLDALPQEQQSIITKLE